MKVLLPLAVAVASASMIPNSLAGPSDSAINNANSNAKFLRCGTEHPTANKAAKEEKRFRALLRQVKNGKKPDRPGGVMATTVLWSWGLHFQAEMPRRITVAIPPFMKWVIG
jgi:hypothetical protein